jgi:ureidoglycolate lyase
MAITIQAEHITDKAFAPFGELISCQGATTFDCNQGRAVRYHDLAKCIDVADMGGKAGLSIYKSIASPMPFLIEVMERHPLGTQIFLPMTTDPGTRFLVAVAPPGDLDLTKVKAFVISGQQGVNYFKGVWHLPIVALDKPIDFVTVDRIGDGNNCDEVKFDPGNFILPPK